MASAFLTLAVFVFPQALSFETTETVQWSYQGIAHAIEVQADHGDRRIVGQPNAQLRSAVGPLFAVVTHNLETIEGQELHHRRIETKLDGFDLIGWLDESSQAGIALSQLVDAPLCDTHGQCPTAPPPVWEQRPHCPSKAAVEHWDGGFVELASLLVNAECIEAPRVRLEPESFWIDAWDGNTATLAVQRDHCIAADTACEPHISWLELEVPPTWLDWLEPTTQGEGFLAGLSTDRETPSADDSSLPSL